jgi:hypothetical protein
MFETPPVPLFALSPYCGRRRSAPSELYSELRKPVYSAARSHRARAARSMMEIVTSAKLFKIG